MAKNAGTVMTIGERGASLGNVSPKISVSLSLGLGPEALKVRKAPVTENQNGNQIPKVSQRESRLRRMARLLLPELFLFRLSAPETVAEDLFEFQM